jgi:hypothetical protein
MQSKVQIEAAKRAERERVLRLNRYSQGRKDQDTIKRLSSALKGKGKSITSSKSNTQLDTGAAGNPGHIQETIYDLRSLDPSMFR